MTRTLSPPSLAETLEGQLLRLLASYRGILRNGPLTRLLGGEFVIYRYDQVPAAPPA